MYIDAFTEVSTSQIITQGSAAVSVSEDSIDLGSAARPVGNGEPVTFEIHVEAAYGGATSLEIEVIDTTAANLTGSVTSLASTGAILTAALTTGTKVRVTVPAGKGTQRYMGLRYTVVGTNNAGTFSAYLAPVVDEQEVYQGVV